MNKPSENELRFAVIAADIICLRIIDGALHALLTKVVGTHRDAGKWAHIGGLIQHKETAEVAVKRLLGVKGRIKNIYSEQLYTFSEIERDSRGRVISIAYLGLCGNDPQTASYESTSQSSKSTKSLQYETKWVSVSEIKSLAYDHMNMLKLALERLRSKITYSNIAQFLLPKEFTFSELQAVYELILGEKFDKRNFRKKIFSIGIISDTGKVIKKGVMRPAALYTFSSKRLVINQIV